MALNIGQYDRRVTLQSRSVALDSHGNEVITWTTAATVWAQRVPLRAGEFFAAAAVQAEQTLKYRIRWRADITPLPTWRLVDAGVNHDITGVMPFGGRNEALELLALQGVKDGR